MLDMIDDIDIAPAPAHRSAESSALAEYVKEIFSTFKAGREPFEEVWEECWSNFLGKYQHNKIWKTKTEGRGARSRIFIKLTALKCNTAHAKISDVLFAGRGGVPFDVAALNPEQYSVDDVQVTEALRLMKKKLKEHFKKINLKRIMDLAILETAIYGTGVLKGPIMSSTRRISAAMEPTSAGGTAFALRSQYEADVKVDRVSIWNYYADTNVASPSDGIGEIHTERLLPSALRLLAASGYDALAIEEAIASHSSLSGDTDDRQTELGEQFVGEAGEKDKRITVLEYWGLVPVKMLRAAGVQLPEDADDRDSIEALVVLAADGILIKASVNPLPRRPFYVCPWKERPGSIYGTGVAEAMRDSQKMVNSCARLIIDNKALSGNGMVGINIDRINTKRTTNLEIYPGKVWYTKGNYSPREVVDSIAFPDVTLGLQGLMEMFERFADEETGIPRYTHGEQGSFLNKTASGMSMLMTQANINLKTVLENIDDYWIEPIVEMFGHWFQEMGEENAMQIPLRFLATGTDSLMAKEIKLESYLKAMQVTSSPQDAIFIDRSKLMKALFDLLETGDVLRSDEEIKVMMEQMGTAASQPKDVREMVDWDRLYPYLKRSEQVQMLNQLGIQPDEHFQEAMQPTQEAQQGPNSPGGMQ